MFDEEIQRPAKDAAGDEKGAAAGAGGDGGTDGGLTTYFYRRGRYLGLVILMIITLGATALLTIGRQEDPTITNLFATILTPLPGASPERVEALVTEPIEARLREIPEIKRIISVSRTGISSVRIELSEFTPKDRIEEVWSEVRDALADAATVLPEGAPDPIFDDDRTGAFTAIGVIRMTDAAPAPRAAEIAVALPGAGPNEVEDRFTATFEARLAAIPEIERIVSSARAGVASIRVEVSAAADEARVDAVWTAVRAAATETAAATPGAIGEPVVTFERAETPLGVMTRFAERLQDRLRQTPGTDFVQLYGAADEEILVEIDPLALASVGLTVDDVSAAVARADAKVRAGRVRGAQNDYLIEVAGRIEDVDRIRAIPLIDGAEGPILRLGDIATVRRSVATPPETIGFSEGERVVLFAVRMTPDLQVDAYMERIRAEVAAFGESLPDGLTIELTFDQSGYTADRLAEVAGNLAIGVALVVGVLFIAMGWRAAVVVAAILPLASLLSLFILQQVGVVIHQMSVTGLIVALGLLVDAAIVMTDEIRKRLVAGETRLSAVSGSVRRLVAPLAASTVTTILAFMPMALLPGPAGDFVGAVAVSVIVMLLSSLVLAVTVTPALAGRLLPSGGAARRTVWWRDGVRLRPVAWAFDRSLRLSLRERGLSILAAASLPVIGFAAFPTLTAQFFPGVDRDQLYVQVNLGEGASIFQTVDAVERVDAELRGMEGVVSVQWVVGRSAPAFYYNMLADRDADPGFAEALVRTASPETTERLIPIMQRRLDVIAPEAQTLVRGLVQGPPVAAPLEMRILGPDLETLRALGEEARRRMSEIASVTHTRAELAGGAPKLVLDLDEDQVRLAGLTLGQVARQLETMLEGAVGGSMLEGGEELPVRVRFGDDARAGADAVARLDILPPGAQALAQAGRYPGIPLTALGDVRVVASESPITRWNGERANTVQAFLLRDVLPEEALAELRANLEARPLDLPADYRIEWGGDSDARGEVVTNLLATVGLVVTLTVATIVLTFNSWRLSVIAFVVTGLAMGLSLLALEIFQYPFGVLALIGVIGSIGVSINAAIIIMTALQEDPDAARGDPDAIRRVVGGSSRHIVSTTVTTFGGFLPLILAGGGFWPPFAMSIAGGVLLSTVVSFYFVPPMFSLAVGRPKRAAGGEPAKATEPDARGVIPAAP